MNLNTPLPEVAHYLPTKTAELLLDKDIDIQMSVLISVRAYLVMVESEVILDPIELQERLDRFVKSCLHRRRGIIR